MQTANRNALKEWAAVCHALSTGQQTILLRSGGIADGRAGFTIEHDEFWLFATRFHQSAEELTDGAAPLLEAVGEAPPPPEMVRLPLYATLDRVFTVGDERHLERLAGLHVLAPQTILNRFHYRQPGLTVLLVRAFLPPRAIDISDAPHYSGCHSWVELTSALPTNNLHPVLADEEFTTQAEEIDHRLATLN